MTIQPCDASIIVDTRQSLEMWCVYEHQVVMQEGEPPQTIMIGAAKLNDVYRLIDGKTNSEWSRIFSNGGHVLVRIVATTPDKMEAHRHAQDLVRQADPKPTCNIRGYNLRGNRRAVICLSNGNRYETQRDAAADLGIHASMLSRHLRGELSHACGLKFAYDIPESERTA